MNPLAQVSLFLFQRCSVLHSVLLPNITSSSSFFFCSLPRTFPQNPSELLCACLERARAPTDSTDLFRFDSYDFVL